MDNKRNLLESEVDLKDLIVIDNGIIIESAKMHLGQPTEQD